MKTFVFFIGGTGARVLRSLTMLLSAGVRLGNDNDSIVPILLDFDATNADMKRTNELLGQYNALNGICKYNEDSFDGGFFRVPLGIREKGEYKPFNSLVKMTFNDERGTFGKYIGYDSIAKISNVTPATKLLIDSLYDSSSSESRDREINLELKFGFKGNPNIGSVVFNEYFKTKQFQEFKDNFNPGDRVFIVGSIFGGTGSSGLPQLVKKIRESVTKTLQSDGSVKAIRESMMGACIVLPYFRVKEKSDSAINSLTFNSKAKAALGFYQDEINDDLCEVYYIGCKDMQGGYENIEGGEKQENNAHIVELLSAMSIVEFARHADVRPDSPTQYYEYTSTSEKIDGTLPSPLFLDVFPKPGQNPVYQSYIKNLNAFALMVKFFQDKTRKPGFFRDSYYKNLEDFLAPGKEFSEKLNGFGNEFIKWSEELHHNTIQGFYPYNFAAKNLYELIKLNDENKPKKQNLDSVITKVLNQECSNDNRKEGSDGGKTYLRAVYDACEEAVNNIN